MHSLSAVPKLARTRLAMSALLDCKGNASTTQNPWELLALQEAIASELILHGLAGGPLKFCNSPSCDTLNP